MKMLKVPSRSQRSRGFKVKHVIQACLFLVICFWLLIQVKRFYDKSKAYRITEIGSEMELNEHEPIKLGRKDLDPKVKALSFEKGGTMEKQELEGEIEEVKSEENEEEGRGGGDDEIDGHDQEKAEEEELEVEDLIDEEDRESEDDIDELETEEKGNQIDESISLENQPVNEGERNLQMTREEHYKGNDASSEVMQNTQTTKNSVLKIRGLRQFKDEDAESTEDIKLETKKENNVINNEVNIDSAKPEPRSNFSIWCDLDAQKKDLARKIPKQFVKNIKTIQNKPL